MLFLIWSVALVAAITLYLREVYSHYSRRGVKTEKVVPVFGTMARVLLRREHFVDNVTRSYKACEGERFLGRYELMKPSMLIRDLELIKRITIKDFEHFLDHRVFVTEDHDPFCGRNLFSLRARMLFLIWSVALVAAITLYLREVYSHYSRRGVKTEKVVPVFGTMARVLLRREHFVENVTRSYKACEGERFFGRYELMKPTMLIRDLELIKRITIKDFEHFLDHRVFVTEDHDPFCGRNLFSLRGQEWKDMRSTLSPAFTSSKMKLMLPFMVDVADQVMLNLKQKIKKNDEGYIDVDVKDLTTRLTNDVIASCAFGLKVDSQTDRQNEFYTQGLNATTFKFKQIILLLLFSYFPRIMKRLKVTLFSESTRRFFKNLVMDTMTDREKRNIVRPDMIHLLMEAKKGKLLHEEKSDTDAGFATAEESSVGKKNISRIWSDDDLIAQAILFFVAGFETVSSTMVFLLYELAVNPDIQDKVAREIKETDAKNGGKFDYNSILDMTYLDMVVSEVLRLWPPAFALDRLCIKDYNLGKPNSTATEDYIMRKGEGLQIPTWPIHHDPEYFPNPEKFDPERFSNENKHNIQPFTYMPFGLGPRNCIGSRFALCEVKVLAYQLLMHMEVTPGPKTPIPVQLERESFNLRMKGGDWLRFKIRS